MISDNKKVKLNLVGLDGNAFSLIGAFKTAARKQGWNKVDIDKVVEECMKGDYDELLCTLLKYTEDEEDEEEDDYYDEDDCDYDGEYDVKY